MSSISQTYEFTQQEIDELPLPPLEWLIEIYGENREPIHYFDFMVNFSNEYKKNYIIKNINPNKKWEQHNAIIQDLIVDYQGIYHDIQNNRGGCCWGQSGGIKKDGSRYTKNQNNKLIKNGCISRIESLTRNFLDD